MIHEQQRDCSGLKECREAGTVHCTGMTTIIDGDDGDDDDVYNDDDDGAPLGATRGRGPVAHERGQAGGKSLCCLVGLACVGPQGADGARHDEPGKNTGAPPR